MTLSLIYVKNQIKLFLDSKNCGKKEKRNNISTMLIYSV